jgi:helix-turn-helix protein
VSNAPTHRDRHSRLARTERDHMRIRRDLLRLFLDVAQKNYVTFYTIARWCNTSNARAWNLLHGRIELFNSETLIDILHRFGVTVDIVVTKRVRVQTFRSKR